LPKTQTDRADTRSAPTKKRKGVVIMAEKDEIIEVVTVDEIGSVKISDDVVSIIAGLAAADVAGVAGMSSTLAGGIAELLGKKNMSKGVKVSIDEQDVTIELVIVVEYGCRIPDVAWEVQEKVKTSVETMTGLNVLKVNIHVQGVSMEAKKEPALVEDIEEEE